MTEDAMSDREIFSFMLSELDMMNHEASEYLGVQQRTIYRWLSGESKIPKTVFLALELERRKVKEAA